MSGGAAVKAGNGIEGDHPVCTERLVRCRPKAKRKWRKTGDTSRTAL